MFCDRLLAKSTQVFAEIVLPFKHERVRIVLVQKKLNIIVGIGGEGRNLVHLDIRTVDTIVCSISNCCIFV